MFLGWKRVAILLAMQTCVLLAIDRRDGSSVEEFTTFCDFQTDQHVLPRVSGHHGVTPPAPTCPCQALRGETSMNKTTSPYSGKVSSQLSHNWGGNYS